jgi:hypothetical protein
VTRADAMAARLPPVFDTRTGTLVHTLLDHLAVPVEALDDLRVQVQRAHWLDTAVERADLDKLGSLLDHHLEPWESTDLFRDRLKAIARARLAGGVAGGPIAGYVADLLAAGRRRLGLDIAAGGRQAGAALVENPPLTGRLVAGPLTPLDVVEVRNDGLDPAPLQANLVGLPGTRAAVPVLAAPDQGVLLGWAGVIPAGCRLRLRVADEGALAASLDGDDVTDRLFSVASFAPGRSLARDDLAFPAAPLLLAPGTTTRLWYVTAGLFDRPELDAVMFAVARGSLRQGRFDQDEYGDALFHQPPPLWAELFWTSPAPACFEVHVPAGVLAAAPPLYADREEARDRLGYLIGVGVDELRGAGIRSGTVLDPLRDVMALTDRVGVGEGVHLTDGAPGAPSPSPDLGALLDVTPLDSSRLE